MLLRAGVYSFCERTAPSSNQKGLSEKETCTSSVTFSPPLPSTPSFSLAHKYVHHQLPSRLHSPPPLALVSRISMYIISYPLALRYRPQPPHPPHPPRPPPPPHPPTTLASRIIMYIVSYPLAFRSPLPPPTPHPYPNLPSLTLISRIVLRSCSNLSSKGADL